jgi:uncharacterized protein YjbJ (UPF0337 family)
MAVLADELGPRPNEVELKRQLRQPELASEERLVRWVSAKGAACVTDQRRSGVGRHMGERDSGPEEAAKGVVEGVKGKAKEAAGAVTGRDDIQREGQAQQDKADSQREAVKKEAEAESARSAAEANEARQKSQQH